MSETSKIWFEETKNLEVGEALYIRVAGKKEQTALANEMFKEREAMEVADPEFANQIFIKKSYKDNKFYVVLERKYRTVFSAFKRVASGELVKITIDPERKRIIDAMLADGYDREAIEDVLNGLTDEEVENYFKTT